MKKYLHIPIALLLIAIGIWGCTLNRPRPLLSCFPTDDWTDVSGSHMLPGEDADGALVITIDQLKETITDVSVRPRRAFPGWTCETVFMHIQTETIPLSVEIGENKDITIARLDDLEGSRTYWTCEDTSLYETLLSYIENGENP